MCLSVQTCTPQAGIQKMIFVNIKVYAAFDLCGLKKPKQNNEQYLGILDHNIRAETVCPKFVCTLRLSLLLLHMDSPSFLAKFVYPQFPLWVAFPTTCLASAHLAISVSTNFLSLGRGILLHHWMGLASLAQGPHLHEAFFFSPQQETLSSSTGGVSQPQHY